MERIPQVSAENGKPVALCALWQKQQEMGRPRSGPASILDLFNVRLALEFEKDVRLEQDKHVQHVLIRVGSPRDNVARTIGWPRYALLKATGAQRCCHRRKTITMSVGQRETQRDPFSRGQF